MEALPHQERALQGANACGESSLQPWRALSLGATLGLLDRHRVALEVALALRWAQGGDGAAAAVAAALSAVAATLATLGRRSKAQVRTEEAHAIWQNALELDGVQPEGSGAVRDRCGVRDRVSLRL